MTVVYIVVLCVFLYISTYIFLQFNDDKDNRETSKIEEMRCPEAYPWQTIKTENEGKTREVCYQSAFLTLIPAKISSTSVKKV